MHFSIPIDQPEQPKGICSAMRKESIGALSRAMNRPSVTLSAIVIALALGATRSPYLEHLRPVGGFYIALLQMCVLPFLLATIPLAVRSAMTSGSAGSVVRGLLIGVAGAIAAVGLAGVLIPALVFQLAPLDERTVSSIGALVGSSAHRVDVEFALDLSRAAPTTDSGETGVLAVIPSNIFASLAGNDSMKVLVFALIFGVGMVTTERRSGNSVFSALRHIQEVCIQIFEWFNLLVPIGIVALIAPQVSRIGPDIYAVLAVFACAFISTSLIILVVAIALMAFALRSRWRTIFSGMLAPMMLGAATRNTLVCIPLAIETLTEKFKVARQPCDLYIPVGFAVLRFGTIVYFAIATLFMGMLLGRSFGPLDYILIAALSVIASFATLGVTGIAALSPLASVLRPFGLSYELAVPLMIIIDPLANMIRVMINVAVNCLIPTFAGRLGPAAQEALEAASAK